MAQSATCPKARWLKARLLLSPKREHFIPKSVNPKLRDSYYDCTSHLHFTSHLHAGREGEGGMGERERDCTQWSNDSLTLMTMKHVKLSFTQDVRHAFGNQKFTTLATWFLTLFCSRFGERCFIAIADETYGFICGLCIREVGMQLLNGREHYIIMHVFMYM